VYGWGTIKESSILYRQLFNGGDSLHLSVNDDFSPEAKSMEIFYNNDTSTFSSDNEGTFSGSIERQIFGK
jgi:hypothetical protein